MATTAPADRKTGRGTGADFPPGIILAAPASGSGKTVLTLGLLRHFRDQGIAVGPAKAGPDYIDPTFHHAAAGHPSLNLDAWAMRPETLQRLAWAVARGDGPDSAGDAAPVPRKTSPVRPLLVEGVMGLFDGAAGGAGSTAALAALTGWPVVLIVDVRGQAQSAAALVHGFQHWSPDVRIAGVLCNRVGGPGHAALLRHAFATLPTPIPVLGLVPRADSLVLPSRHLGLIPAAELPAVEATIRRAGCLVGDAVDGQSLLALAASAEQRRDCGDVGTPGPHGADRLRLPPLGQRIAVACDDAFCFAYPHLLADWLRQGAELKPFAPLADEPPPAGADAVFLPGGYPELHSGRLAANTAFLDGVRRAAAHGWPVYGECGGYMVLGAGLVDANGHRHAMADLLPVTTSFAERRLHLGYREMTLAVDHPFGRRGTVLRGHEFHFASILSETPETPLFGVRDAAGADRPAAGAVRGSVAGSFLHAVDFWSGSGVGEGAA